MASTTLRFNAAIYSKAALEATREAYAEFARLAVAREGGTWVVDVEPLTADLAADVLALEIMNFALAETAHQKRGVSA
jgi:hypothetical protein